MRPGREGFNGIDNFLPKLVRRAREYLEVVIGGLQA
jgi:hypothetical protein